ncbi:histidinol-phosphate transaminase [Ammoniphilus sp. CFH 90114]|uniref:histidinol-phosphate transaminase n=1 Tax=Ammoniphilus sp. CFH 90114 TaxID=2493665 RepID=UPI00100E196C|nr:histidinol-phosphate transaminase [Ammoniphilus sp. CFH 90114]RXT08815.1 histidinol-phosphate transaminase [Ammoniphilus sp. CFH 90114]
MNLLDKIPTRKEIESLGVYVPGKPIEEVKRELGLEKIYKLASNENPFGFSDLARDAMIREVNTTNSYPEGTAPVLAEKIALHLGVAKESVIVGNGSDELIRLLSRAYIRPEDEVIMADVTFPRYETNIQIEGGKVVTVPLVDGVHDLSGMLEAINDQTRMIFVCNPNNPTGTIVGRVALSEFIEKVPPHILLVVDEAYYEYVTDEDYLQTLPMLEDHPNLIILRTFSKIYGLAALRVGYGMMHPSIVKELMKVKEPFNTNRIAQAAACASLDDAGFVEDCKQKNAEGRTYLAEEVARLGYSSFPSQGNFIMIQLDRSGDEVFQALLKQGIIVRSGGLLGYPQTIRVSVGTPEENQAFIQAFKEAMVTSQ